MTDDESHAVEVPTLGLGYLTYLTVAANIAKGRYRTLPYLTSFEYPTLKVRDITALHWCSKST